MPEKRYTLQHKQRIASKLDLTSNLNESQRRAVETDAPRVLILAGAGSGKTRTLTYRVARLIEKGAAPDGIVLVTFTNRAAREMVARIDQLLGAAARNVRAGTFHHLANRALRKHGATLGLRAGYGILDREDGAELMNAAIADAGVDVAARRFPSGDLLAALASLARSCDQPAAEAIVRRMPYFAPLEAPIARVLELYEKRKQEMNVVDFDDLLIGWRTLLARGDELAKRLQLDVQHVLVDEFQDTNRLQAEIAELLAAECGSLCVVGDDAQSIYAFRGAEFENILDFPRRKKTEVHVLDANYRSTPEILALANEVIRKNPLQFPKDLSARRSRGMLPVIVPAKDPLQQAEFVAQRVLELREEGIDLEQQAVLYRAHSHGIELQIALARRDIPFIVRSGLRFFEQAHVKDALSFLRVIANPYDELAWRRMLDMIPGVGARTALKIFGLVREAALAGRDPIAELALPAALDEVPKRAHGPYLALARLLAGIARDVSTASPGELVRRLLERTPEGETAPLVEHITVTHANAESRLAELAQLAEVAAQHADLESFLSDAALVTELTGEEATGAVEERDLLTLSTVHQAKGLEWRAVFVVGLTDGGFPIQNALEEPGGEAEERRLFYVAVTRAMEQLYLCYPATRPVREDERSLMRPSRFLADVAASGTLHEKWVLDAS
jgi:DNA helicase II / ATP-dependent DNA helicase PcrA